MTANTTSGTNQVLASAGPSRSRIRWFVLFLISLMYLITYMDRANISVTATAMASEFGLSKIDIPQVLHAGRRAGDGLVVVGATDPEEAILWIHLVSQIWFLGAIHKYRRMLR